MSQNFLYYRTKSGFVVQILELAYNGWNSLSVVIIMDDRAAKNEFQHWLRFCSQGSECQDDGLDTDIAVLSIKAEEKCVRQHGHY